MEKVAERDSGKYHWSSGIHVCKSNDMHIINPMYNSVVYHLTALALLELAPKLFAFSVWRFAAFERLPDQKETISNSTGVRIIIRHQCKQRRKGGLIAF